MACHLDWQCKYAFILTLWKDRNTSVYVSHIVCSRHHLRSPAGRRFRSSVSAMNILLVSLLLQDCCCITPISIQGLATTKATSGEEFLLHQLWQKTAQSKRTRTERKREENRDERQTDSIPCYKEASLVITVNANMKEEFLWFL